MPNVPFQDIIRDRLLGVAGTVREIEWPALMADLPRCGDELELRCGSIAVVHEIREEICRSTRKCAVKFRVISPIQLPR